MALLRFKNEKPAFGGYTYLQKETALILTAGSLGELTRQVIAHRKHKSLPFGSEADVQKEIERWICGRLGSNECISEGADDPWVPITTASDFFDLAKIKAASSAGWEWVKAGDFASKEEAQRRAGICSFCPCNASFSGCKCGPLAQWVAAIVPKDRIISAMDNRGCAVCSCSLQALVNAPAEAIIASEKVRPLKYPVGCWKLGALE